MNKNTRMISLIGVNNNIEGMLSTYFHLLKPQLKDHWVIDRFSNISDIVITTSDFDEAIVDNSKVVIVIDENIKVQRIKTPNTKAKIMAMLLPINSSKIIETLNEISYLEPINDKNKTENKETFSLKNLFSKFMKRREKNNTPLKEQKQNKEFKVANKIMQLQNCNSKQFLKIVLLGRPGSGKTTLVSSASTDNLLTSEVKATDSVGLLKENTTIGIDYCEYESNNILMRIYGTPGQRRYDYVQTQTVARADIYIILVDLSSVAPFAEFCYYKDIIDSVGNKDAMKVVAFTHFDIKENCMIQLSKEIRKKCNGEILTVKIDSRKTDEVRFLFNNLSKMKVGEQPIINHYKENQLFLKNYEA